MTLAFCFENRRQRGRSKISWEAVTDDGGSDGSSGEVGSREK